MSHASSNTLWKDLQRLRKAELTLNSLVFDDASSSSMTNASWPSASSSVASASSSVASSTSSCSSSSVVTVQVPQDYATLPAAVDFANQEFQKHDSKCAAQSRSNMTKTIKILIDPRRVCAIEEPLLVQAHKHGHLILDVVDSSRMRGDPAEPRSNKRARTSSLSSAEAPRKGVISMETQEPNQPLLLHSSGSLTIRNLRLEHYSPVDMFVLAKTRSRNAALVVEHGDDKTHPEDHVLKVTLEHVALTSYAGRGIINRCHHPNCQIHQHDCFVAKLWS